MAVPDMRTADVAGESFARLPEIALDELAASASLLTRIDRKYLLQADVAADLVASLAASGARALAIDGQSAFGYLSDYDDTPDFSLYRAAATKRRRRFKLRSRVYLDSGMHFLELKTRSGRGHNVKDRLRLEDVPVGVCAAMRLGRSVKRPDLLVRPEVREWLAERLAYRGDRRNPPRGAEGRGQPDPGGPIGVYAFDPLPARRLSADGRSRPRPLRALGRGPRRGSRRRRRNEVRRARLRRRQVALEQRTSPAEDLEVRARRRVDPSRIALQPLE